jgi:DNA-directed RNA polymerase subunit RPC12/RpoP
MFTLLCESCGEKYHADEGHAGSRIRCTRCGHIIRVEVPRPPTAPPPFNPEPFAAYSHPFPERGRQEPHTQLLSNLSPVLVGSLLLLVLGIYLAFNDQPQSARGPSTGPVARTAAPRTTSPPTPKTPAELLQDRIVSRDTGRLGDPNLNAEFETINARYFASKLPAMPALWEPKLQEVGPLIAKGFTLEGLAASYNGRQFILINSVLRKRPQELRRTLCHEMVHEYLYTLGDTTTNHGAAFQRILLRLSEEGAFEGKWASASEKTRLRSWLHREAGRLEAEKASLVEPQKIMEGERATLNSQSADLNARIATANDQQSGWPSDQEIDSFKSRREALNQRADEYNVRVEEYSQNVARFNHEVNRFNLMMAYPDGLDEESAVQSKALTITYSSNH